MNIEQVVNTVICGDCLEIMKEMPDESVDFIFADPPYGVEKAKWDSKTFDARQFTQQCLRLSKHGVAITCGQGRLGDWIVAFESDYKGVLAARNLNGMTFNQIGFGNWIPVVLAGNIMRGQDFFDFAVKGKKPDHPCPKPIEFMRKLILRFTYADDVVLDPLLGSGTTAVACKELGRKFIGIEINPEYCKIAEQRLAQMYLEL